MNTASKRYIKKISLTIAIVLTISNMYAAPLQSETIFASGWEYSPGTGCTAPIGIVDLHITDNLNFDNEHSLDPCNALGPGVPSMSVVSSPVHSGNYAFRYTCPDQSWYPNGPGGIVQKTFFSPQRELYIRYYAMWSSNFRFLEEDYKSTFVHYSGGHTYNSYYGKEGDPLHGRLRYFYSGEASVAPWSTNITLNLGQWHCVEWHLVAGDAGIGYVEAKVDGTSVQWTTGGTRFYVPAGENLGYFTAFSLDNTINPYADGSFPASITGDAYIYYDDIVINNGDGWIGPAAGGSGSDDGGEGAGDKSGGGCFIATAAFGSPMHPYVDILRKYRDQVLLKAESGRAVVSFYKRVSPPVADFISGVEIFRILACVLLIPMVVFCWIALHTSTLFTFGIIVVLIILLKYNLLAQSQERSFKKITSI